MKRSLQILSFLALGSTLQAATHAVLPGEAIQPKINAAASGDVIAIFGGTYSGDVIINKAVRLVEVDGQEVMITGNVTWSNVTNAPPFEGFTVGSVGKGITVTNTTGFVIKNVVTTAGSGLAINGTSNVSVIGGQHAAITQNGGELSVVDSSVDQAFNASVGSQKTVALRCVLSIGDWNTSRGFLGYCKNMLYFKYSGSNGKVVIVGNHFDRPYHHQDAIGCYGANNDVFVANCVINNAQWGRWHESPDHVGRGICVSGSGNRSKIFNNFIYNTFIGDNPAHATVDFHGGCGIRADQTTSEICNNIIVRSQYGITAPYGTFVSNNLIGNTHRGLYRGGCVPLNPLTFNYFSNSLFASYPHAGQAWEDWMVLRADSVARNAGIDDPIFNDFDGSRNDIGILGGAFSDPGGRIPGKPVVISFDLAPQQLLKGVDTQVTISNGQAVAQP